MISISDVPTWAWVAGAPTGFFAVRILWPTLRDSLSAQSGQWRMESGFIRQLSEELQQVKSERDAADRRADELFGQLTDLRAEMTVMMYKQEHAASQIETLKDQLATLMGARNDESR